MGLRPPGDRAGPCAYPSSPGVLGGLAPGGRWRGADESSLEQSRALAWALAGAGRVAQWLACGSIVYVSSFPFVNVESMLVQPGGNKITAA